LARDETREPNQQWTEDVVVRKNFKYYLAASVALATIIVYLAALRNDFVEWDDGVYIVDNVHIRSLDTAFFKWAFFDFYAANWHPLTWMSHALDYALWGLNPLGHHLTNIILHAINTFLVVMLVIRLLDAFKARTSGSERAPFLFLTERSILIAAGVTGLLFGLHPVHVESVAWVAERKDLLCALFFLLSIIMYTNYALGVENEVDDNNAIPRFLNRRYLVTLGFFTLALLSKPMAVTLPVVLLILDWYPLNRLQSFRTPQAVRIMAEKIPFFVLSLAASIVTIMAQKAGGALVPTVAVPLSARTLVAAKSLIAYLFNMALPYHLIPFYAYPGPGEISLFHLEYPLAIAFFVGITAACVGVMKKWKLWLSVWSYYVVTLLPVLGIVQVGGQAMADRYTYLPSLGPFLIAGLGGAWLLAHEDALKRRIPAAKTIGAAVVVSVFITLSYLSFKQIGVWKNSFVLPDYILEKEPPKDPRVYLFRGMAFERTGRLDKAIEDYDRAIALDPSYYQAFLGRGAIFRETGRLDKAIEDYDRAIALNPAYDQAFFGRGATFEKMGKFDSAIEDYGRAIALNPENYEAYNNRGMQYRATGQLDKAIADFDKTIALCPSSEKAYFNLGGIYAEAGLFDKAIENFNRSIVMDPAYADAYANRGITRALSGQAGAALEDFNKAIELKQNFAVAYFNRGKLYLTTGRRELALADFQKACSLGDEAGCNTVRELTRGFHAE
jgi:tetratricopeptide (TPR) repeat protein